MGYLQIWYRLSTNVKDNIGHANVATMAKSQLMSMLQSCSYENILGQGQYKLNVRKADYKVLQSHKVNTKNCCNPEKWTLQTLVMKRQALVFFCSLLVKFVVYVQILQSFVVQLYSMSDFLQFFCSLLWSICNLVIYIGLLQSINNLLQPVSVSFPFQDMQFPFLVKFLTIPQLQPLLLTF